MSRKGTFIWIMLLLSAFSFAQTVVDIPINSSNGSAEEDFSGDGYVSTSSSDLEFYYDGTSQQVVGVRFENIPLPQNAVITNAYIQFQVDENGAGDVTVNVTADDTDNAAVFGSSVDYGLSSRTKTTANVDWIMANWTGQIGAYGTDQRTPDLSALLTEITSRENWQQGNSMAFLFTGISRSEGAWREAESSSAGTPSLHIEYETPAGAIATSTITLPLASASESAEEAYSTSGYVSTVSSDLELYYDGSVEQVVGLRFTNVTLPQNAEITNAYIQFEVDENGNGDVTVNIKGDDTDSASALGSNGNFGLSTRAMTSANVNWSIPTWEGQVGQAGVSQRTPDVSAIITEITAREGWVLGNNIAFLFSGVSRSDGAYREAASFSNGKPSLHIEYVTPPTEMEVSGDDVAITSGDTTPEPADFTQFENTGINQTSTKTFSIQNVGDADLNLTGDPVVAISGDSSFTILAQPTATILESNENTTFVVQYAPNAAVTNTATITIENNDSDENPYTFAIQASGVEPIMQLDVLGNTVAIANADTTPDTTDNTDFGDVYTVIGKKRIFTLQNTGNSLITINSITSSNANFTINLPQTTVNVNETVSFEITLVPTSLEVVTSTITINSNAITNNPFTFTVQGQGTDPVFPMAVSAGDNWFYLADGSNQGTEWRSPSFDQGDWTEAATEIGYGDGDETTNIGQPATPRPLTTYFRKYLSIADASIFNSIDLEAIRDDGIVVYINNIEVWRNNMPAGDILFDTAALSGITGANESAWNYTSIPADALVNGVNCIAVEIHQEDEVSSDISFNLKLTPSTQPVAAPPTEVLRGPYLQSGTATSVVVKWRTDIPTASVVNYGTELATLSMQVFSENITTEHEVTLTDLSPNTTYYFNIANQSVVVKESTTGDMFVKTAPINGTDQFVRAWILGDAGTGSINQRNVRDAYYNYVSTTTAYANQTDMMLFLGDNAYSNGTDAEHQSYFFNVYHQMLQKSVAWSCLGNHDGYTSDLATQSGPYYDIFTFPTAAQAGGVASGTEAYYSFDYANIHFIVLDSHQSGREVGGSQYLWAQSDMQNTTQDWIVALFHHPAYSKGSHDSDYEGRLIDMRENFMPLLEQNGVDLVLNGHSHSYERSYFINGHQGASNTFNSNEITNGGHTVGVTGSGSGRVDGTGAYNKTLEASEGAVYITTGSAGQISGGDLDHEAMFLSLNQLGSCVMEIDSDGLGGQNLTIKFIRDTGAIDDYFTIHKTGVTLSVEDREKTDKSIKIYPVPADDLLNIKVNSNEKLEKVKFYNNVGKLVEESTKETINVSKLITGTYIVEVVTNKQTYYKSIIIK
ncbi:choice-of-anchor D domain-containing protein [Flavobacterium sp. SM2513]|uniref:choice-of-anchor D domain-containing protein n=1 Tax=Flavobacterium sp. SM2513 TaxID=3424766 RepID=UPI003D7FF714